MIESEDRPSVILGGDHAELDRLWEVFQAIPDSDCSARRLAFDAYQKELMQHMRVEEELLFPRLIGPDPALTSLARRLLEEHVEIRQSLDGIDHFLTTGEGSMDSAGMALINVLWEHNAREEAQAYPWFDQHLSIEDAREVRRRMTLKPP
ncbi:MAG TPA: hemerythrin domain-containing protein [Candidatus Acidoferrum sp.]|nr:hemerythrin domain-containing protein [Candidatus Acidoferrum sp.]